MELNQDNANYDYEGTPTFDFCLLFVAAVDLATEDLLNFVVLVEVNKLNVLLLTSVR